MMRFAYLLALMLMAAAAGCAEHKRAINPAPHTTFVFRNVHDNKCLVRDVTLDSKTGAYIVTCK